MRAIRIAALAHIEGWVKRDTGTIFVGFTYLNMPQQSELASRLANPTRSVADHRLNSTFYHLSFKPRKWIPSLLILGNNKRNNPAFVPMATTSMNARRDLRRILLSLGFIANMGAIAVYTVMPGAGIIVKPCLF